MAVFRSGSDYSVEEISIQSWMVGVHLPARRLYNLHQPAGRRDALQILQDPGHSMLLQRRMFRLKLAK